MKSLLIAAVIGLMAAGCAEGIDDPQPGPDPTASNSAGTAQQDSAELPDTHIDPAKLGTGVATPKEDQTYENPGGHPGWVGEKLNNVQTIDEERTFNVQVQQLQQQIGHD